MNLRWNGLVTLAVGILVAVGSPVRPGEPGDDRDEWERFNERCASDSLKTLTAAEADFRANDRDWCHVNDFWTSNPSGLYTMASASEDIRKTQAMCSLSIIYWDGIGIWHANPRMLQQWSTEARRDPAIRLIEVSIQSADSEEK